MAEIVNGRCHAEKAPQASPPLFQHGHLVIQLHDIGWIVSSCFTLVAMIVSFWLIDKHLQWYTNKAQQRYVVRILLMVPIYAVVSLASYLFWNHSTPLLLLRDCYESTVLTSFFYLLLLYLSPDPVEQKDIFRKFGLSRENDLALRRLGQEPKKWMFPLGFVKRKPKDGFYFLQLMKWGILQYCVIRPTTTLAAVILDYAGLYCEDSWSPGWGHLYITCIVSISVSVAMYCLLQLYVPVSHFLKPQQPLLKLIAIKAVVFLTFWQASGLSLLTMFNVVKDTPYMTADNINIGIGAILETFEMMIFAFVHIKAFTYKPYYDPPNRTRRLRALAHAFNFKETADELWAGLLYMWHKHTGRETDVQARRQAALEDVFGRSRIEIDGPGGKRAPRQSTKESDLEKEPLAVTVSVEETVHVGQERQWLGVGNDYGYGLGWHSRHQQEKSDELAEQIEHELSRRGYPLQDYTPLETADPDRAKQEPLHRKRTSWWNNMYTRLAHSDLPEVPSASSEPSHVQRGRSQHKQKREFRKMAGRKLSQIEVQNETYDDPPPPSFIRSYREGRSHKTNSDIVPSSSLERAILPQTLAFPLPVASATPTAPMSATGSADSFLARAFPPNTDASRSTEALTSAGATSTQSHRSRLHLSAGPSLVPRTVVAHSPIITPQSHPPLDRIPYRHSAASMYPTERDVDIDLSAEPLLHSTRSHRRDSAVYSVPGERHTSRPRSQYSPHYSPAQTNPHPAVGIRKPTRPRRDQIVLPAPLAPSVRLPGSITRDMDRVPLPPSQSLDPDSRVASRRLTLPSRTVAGPGDEIVGVAQAHHEFDSLSTVHLPPRLHRQGATRTRGRRYTDTSLQRVSRQ